MSKKKYIIDDERLMKEWNWEENNKISLYPNFLTFGSNKKVSWKCLSGHIWEDTITHRTNGRNCPYCSNKRLLKGYNDLATKYPYLLKEWNYKRNIYYLPDSIFPFSNKKIWWICENGHEWQDSPNHRISRNNGCPYCSNHRVLSGFNDLATTHKFLVKEWNFAKNENLLPSQVMHGSQQKVWWICNKGHEWQATIGSRTNGVGCPFCKKELATSFPEQAIYFYIKKLFPDAINRYVCNKNELDIFIPSIKVGIEYDGMLFHKENKREKEIQKDNYFSQQGVLVLRVKEKLDAQLEETQNKILYYSPNYMYKNLSIVLKKLIKTIFLYSNKQQPLLTIDLEKDYSLILESFLSTLKENSLLKDEILGKEWNYIKNNKLNPEYLSIGSGYKVWWICNKGHEWRATINSRKRGNNCPYCSNQKVLSGYNDLQTKLPELAKQWHPTKNGDLLPNMISIGSSKKVWWKCEKGHEWQAIVYSRTKGVGCPYCSNQKVLFGYNDLQTKFPELAKQWHPTKNGDLLPNMISTGSSKKVWWKCPKCKNEWQSQVNLRTKSKSLNCPKCSKKITKIN